MKILITGTAGFIGFHLTKTLLKNPDIDITGIDNINDYYAVSLKYDRLKECGIKQDEISDNSFVISHTYPNYRFAKMELSDGNTLRSVFDEYCFDIVIHLAAQAGVRYSIDNPMAYIQSNIVSFTNILECCRHKNVKHLIYASSSSVYGMANKSPFSEDDNVDYPMSLYAATKKSNELMAHTYSHLFKLPCTGLRFFTVYGPWGRPDMAPMLFTNAITKKETIKVFNYGDMLRDFTYVDDIIESIIRLINKAPDQTAPHPYYEIYNIGNSSPVKLMDFLTTLEKAIGIQAKYELLPMQPGDVTVTYADTKKLENRIDFKPKTPLNEGIAKFIKWYRSYFGM